VASAQSIAHLLNRHTDLHPGLRSADVIVSVPSSSAGTGRMDLAAYCSREIARERSLPLVALRRTRAVSSQKDVPRDERIANQMNSMVLATRIQGARALIIDDIYTDGGTMQEACRATRAAGARVVMGLNAAKTVTGAQGFWL
jgi:predicted amidophosphoribosyltransferase